MTDPVELTKRLVQIDSCNPGNCENKVGDYLYRRLSDRGIHTWRQEVMPERSNVLAEIPGFSDLPPLILVCHMDTVVAGQGWIERPFGAEIRDGRLYGRGACDMKSGLACALSAVEDLQAEIPELRRGLRLIMTVDEEGDMRGIQAAVKEGYLTARSPMVDLEPTGLALSASHKGRIWYEFQAAGKTAHASMPWEGADAISAMAEFISRVRHEIAGMPAHTEMGHNTIVFGQISGGYQPYVVPDECRVTVDIRPVFPYGTADMEAALIRAKVEAEQQVPGVELNWRLVSSRPWICGDYNTPLCRAFEYACKEVLGTPPVHSLFPGYTDTALAVATLGSGNCISFGPGQLRKAHRPDEFVDINEICSCRKIIDAVIRQICI